MSTRVFRRGELSRAVLAVLDDLGEANGYAIMGALVDRLGGRWRASPGAVYPALLGLEDAGLIVGRDRDGTRTYRLSPSGAANVTVAQDALAAVTARAHEQRPPDPTLGELVDEALAVLPRQRSLAPPEAEAVRVHLAQLVDGLHPILDPPAPTPPNHARSDKAPVRHNPGRP